MKQDNLWLRYTQEDRKEADGVCERYKSCLLYTSDAADD